MQNYIQKALIPKQVSLAEFLMLKENQFKSTIALYLHQMEERLSTRQRICTYLLLAFLSAGILIHGLCGNKVSSNPKGSEAISISAGIMNPIGLFPVWSDSTQIKFQPKTNTSWKINE